VGERRQRVAAGIYNNYRPRAVASGHRGLRSDVCVRAIKTNIGDSLNIVVHIERRPGRRFISQVLEIFGYNPDADLFDYQVVFHRQETKL
jgi:hypothetical protein